MNIEGYNKKKTTFNKEKKQKILKLIFSLAVILVLFVGGVFVKRVPLTERSIVIGIGLDKSEIGIKVYSQCVVGGESSTPGAASSYVVLDGEGETVTQALDNLKKKTSTTPSYAHCNILFVGTELLENGFDKAANTLFTRGLLQDNTQVIAVEGTAEDAITTNVPILSSTSEYMSREIKLTSQNGGRSLVNLKNYVQRLKPFSGTRYVTLAKKVPTNKPTGSNQNDNKSVFLFDLSNTAVFDYDNKVHYYGKEVTEGVGLIEAKGGGFITTEINGKKLIVNILASSKIRSYKKEPAYIKGVYTYYVRLTEQDISEDISELNIPEIRDKLQQTIKEKIEYSYKTGMESGVDIFSLKSRLCKRYGEELQGLTFEKIKWDIEVKVVMK